MIDIDSIRHRGLKELVTRGRSRAIPPSLADRTRNRVAVLEAMTTISELPPSYRGHELTGKRRGTWSIWVSGSWRITFVFANDTVFDLDLEQYH